MRATATQKIRVRATDGGGKPLARLRVELLDLKEPALRADKGDKRERSGKSDKRDKPRADGQGILRALTTSRDGFVIFSMRDLSSPGVAGLRLAVRFAQDPTLVFPIGSNFDLDASSFIEFALVDLAAEAFEATVGPWHDDGLDADDIWAIPGVFPDLGPLEFGDSRCGRLVPNDQTVRITNHNHVVRTRKNVVTCLRAPGEDKAHDGVGIATSGQSREVHLHAGDLFSYEVKATRLGYTYGDLLYSLPLAPCESVTLAISNWEQRQQARAEQQSASQEASSASYQRQNTLSEALSAVSSSSHKAWGVMTGNSSGGTGSASGSVGAWSLTGAAAMQTTVGASASGAYNRASFASNATRSFSDRIQSSAEAIRRDHQVVIMEQSETENQAISYRTVCNNNHCHVLNIFYHEVLTNFRVSTRVLGHREVYFVPYEVRPFTVASAICARPFLLPFILDEGIRHCYEQLSGASTSGKPASAEVDEFKIDITTGAVISRGPENFHFLVELKSGQSYTIPVPNVGDWQSNQSYSYTVSTQDFDLSEIHNVGMLKFLSVIGPMQTLELNSVAISARQDSSGSWTQIASGTAQSALGPILRVMLPVIHTPAQAAGPMDDAHCADDVVNHLNCNAHYYNSILWLLEDPNERICRFDKIICEDTGHSLADLILPEPIAVMGCTVAFAKADSNFIPYDGPVILDERLLTLPTPGIFADAALGQCSACEKVDDGVYWDWKDTPCACGGKDVSLKNPTDTALIQPGVSVFPTMATAAWAPSVSPPSGETGATNSLVSAFGSALATALASGADSTAHLTQLQLLLNKLTETVADIMPEPTASGGSTPAGPE